MGKFLKWSGLVALLVGSAAFAQSQDPGSPRAGNGERGRELLSVLGPRPAGGFSPLQQQELSRRVRCAATRQQIQDELDVEAAGTASSLYVMSELRMIEKETCAPVPLLPGMQPAAPAPVPQAPKASFVPPPVAASASQPQSQKASPVPPSTPPRAQQLASKPAPVTAPPAAAQPAKPVATGPAFTPAPDYPHDEMAAGHEGVVMVQLAMNADGSVKAAAVAKSCGFPVLDASALAAAKTWRIPAAAGRTINVPLTFTAQQ
ncbi:MAG TPA: energy transducer TonB [Xanthomonadaceae bacterium]|jgi:TonB family protein